MILWKVLWMIPVVLNESKEKTSMEQKEYKFPDEQDEFQVEVEDDTPAEDRDKKPSEAEFVESL